MITEKIQICLDGPLTITHAGYPTTALIGGEAALLACLCTSPNLLRSRKWLTATIWGDQPYEISSKKLRQTLWKLKKRFSHSPSLEADAVTVRLRKELIEIRFPTVVTAERFLEGIDLKDEAFEEWLRETRSFLAMPTRETRRNFETISTYVRPVVQLGAFRVDQDQPTRSSAQQLRAWIYQQIRNDGSIDLVDVECSVSPPLTITRVSQTIPPTIEVTAEQLSVSPFLLLVRVSNPYKRLTLWSKIIDLTLCRISGSFEDIVDKSAREVASATFSALDDLVKRLSPDRLSLRRAVPMFFSMDASQRNTAADVFSKLSTENPEALAWLAYSKSVQIAERFGSSSPEILDEINELIAKAEEGDRNSQTIHAISGHIRALIFDDLDAAAERFSIVSQSYASPTISRLLLSMFNNYIDQPKKAIEIATPLQEFGIGSQYEFFFRSPAMVGSFISQDFKSTISLGEKILKIQPGFLGAQRYIFASQALLGSMDDARQTLKSIRERDKEFSQDTVLSGLYPVPTKTGRELIGSAFSKLNVN